MKAKLGNVKSTDDSDGFRKVVVEAIGKKSTCMVVYPYGMTANAPENALAVTIPINGEESNRVAFLDYPQERTARDLEVGEVMISNYLTKANILFRADGAIIVTAAEIEHHGNSTFFGNVTMNAGVTTINNPTTITENTSFTGDTLTHNGTNVGDDHKHPQDPDSAGNTEADTGGPQ